VSNASIRPATAADRAGLFDVWLRSVRATHTFLTEQDVEGLVPAVREYLASTATAFWVLGDEGHAAVGFMGMNGPHMESLFLAPEAMGRGHGRAFVEHARRLHGEITVDVNEQNEAARRFYEACGFVVERRSEVDEAGRPFPLLHLRLPAPG
jgi:putative acetyltransferase